MKKAMVLMKLLSKNHKKKIPEKYAKVILQVATLEERINTLKDFGMTDRAQEMNKVLIGLIEALKKEYKG